MTTHHTAKAYSAVGVAGARRAPSRIDLLGDKRRPESTDHIITFPGGAIELNRLDDGSYWAHILVNPGTSGQPAGEVVDGRLDRLGVPLDPVVDLAEPGRILQVALRIRPASAGGAP